VDTEQESVAAWYARATQVLHRAWLAATIHEQMLRTYLDEIRAAGNRPPQPAKEPERGRLVPFPERRSPA